MNHTIYPPQALTGRTVGMIAAALAAAAMLALPATADARPKLVDPSGGCWNGVGNRWVEAGGTMTVHDSVTGNTITVKCENGSWVEQPPENNSTWDRPKFNAPWSGGMQANF